MILVNIIIIFISPFLSLSLSLANLYSGLRVAALQGAIPR
jgi:hypothetical protein